MFIKYKFTTFYPFEDLKSDKTPLKINKVCLFQGKRIACTVIGYSEENVKC